MAQYAHKQWQTMLKMLAWRDAPVELSRRGAQDEGPPIVYRSRLFEVEEDGAIIVERPGQAVGDQGSDDRDDIELLLMHNGDRLIATCTIRDTHLRWINQAVRVPCYRLSPGRRPQREQRRSFYRVNVAAVSLEPVLLETPATGDQDEQPLQIKARLVNLSAGGVGVSVRARKDTLGKIKRTRSFRCTMRFEDGLVIEMPTRVAHIGARGDDLLYLGLQTDIDDEVHARSVQDQLQHLCTQFQRAQLQRRRA